MAAHPLQISLERVEQHLSYSRQLIQHLANSNPLRIQAVFDLLAHAFLNLYKEGEGWIEHDVHRMIEAIDFAAKKHQTQLRKDQSRTSYLVHLLAVAYHLLHVGKVRSPDIIIASLLHDTLEDTETSYQELVNVFGDRVANFVQEVTDDKNLAKEERKRQQILTAPHKSAGAAQIKLADKWHNLHDLLQFPPLNWSKQRVLAYFEWAQQVIQALPWVNANLLRSTQEVIEEFHKSRKENEK